MNHSSGAESLKKKKKSFKKIYSAVTIKFMCKAYNEFLY